MSAMMGYHHHLLPPQQQDPSAGDAYMRKRYWEDLFKEDDDRQDLSAPKAREQQAAAAVAVAAAHPSAPRLYLKTHGTRVARLHLLDWVVLALLVALDGALNAIEPFHRFVSGTRSRTTPCPSGPCRCVACARESTTTRYVPAFHLDSRTLLAFSAGARRHRASGHRRRDIRAVLLIVEVISIKSQWK
ncbi:transcription factor PCF3 [Panicum miliaceum]|uniref:Transcription factor PCF3 n=1 Tax=Panicum miliaceum TaxID=4540 RepID=A0A3L6QNQ0_PANMI|nr:transcription factor PCF3 [Panicum miliaceum]